MMSYSPSKLCSPRHTKPIAPRKQTQLEIGAVNDPLEQQADAAADHIMRMPMSGAAFEGVSLSGGTSIQRKCADCPQDETVQRKSTGEGGSSLASPQLSHQIQSTKGGGQAMDGHTRSFMESGFGRDFSQVKIHTGEYAHQMNRELGAKAFTVGNDIYFRDGEFQPAAEGGKRLLAHELMHTVQQGTKISMKIQRACTAAEIALKVAAMHVFCDKPRSCNMQTDTCATANAKVAAGNGCITARTNIQKNCYKPGDPGYQTHMQQIAEAYAALRNCEAVATAKCNTPKPPVVVPDPIPVVPVVPVPVVPKPLTTTEKMLEFAKNVVNNGLDATKAAEDFLNKNPGMAAAIIALGIIGIIALVADDATVVGIADDVLIVPLAVLVRVAARYAIR